MLPLIFFGCKVTNKWGEYKMKDRFFSFLFSNKWNSKCHCACTFGRVATFEDLVNESNFGEAKVWKPSEMTEQREQCEACFGIAESRRNKTYVKCQINHFISSVHPIFFLRWSYALGSAACVVKSEQESVSLRRRARPKVRVRAFYLGSNWGEASWSFRVMLRMIQSYAPLHIELCSFACRACLKRFGKLWGCG